LFCFHTHMPSTSPYSLSLTLSIYLPPLTGIHPQTGPVLPSYPSFFKMCIDCSKGVWLGISHTHVFFHYISPLYSLLFLYCLALLLFSSFQCIWLYHLHTQSQCISKF
jgi:hypothetical protein